MRIYEAHCAFSVASKSSVHSIVRENLHRISTLSAWALLQ